MQQEKLLLISHTPLRIFSEPKLVDIASFINYNECEKKTRNKNQKNTVNSILNQSIKELSLNERDV